MKKTLMTLILIFCLISSNMAQDSVQHRMIFIGDAGEINHKQKAIIPYASELVLEGKTAVLYLGDNVTVSLAGRHPIWTYGVHGGNYSWKDHLFPLTAKFKYLWIPLPVVGSLYPLTHN